MSDNNTFRHNHPDDLPCHFGSLRVVGPADQEEIKYRRLSERNVDHLSSGATPAQQKPTQVVPHKQPILATNKEVKAAYQTNNWAKIKQIEGSAQRDLQPLYDIIKRDGKNAFSKVQDPTGKEFYMVWSSAGCIWSNTESMTEANDAQKSADPNTKYQAIAQFGTYSKGFSILGIHSYNFGLTTMIVQSVIAYILASVLSSFIAEGLGFLVANFAIRLTMAAAALGFEAFSFMLPAALIASVATCICFAIVFIGLMVLWNFLNRKYTIRCSVYNWSDDDWELSNHACVNAINPGTGSMSDQLGIKIPKMIKANEIIYPPGFNSIEALDSTCFYAILIYENLNTFMQGCDFVIQASWNHVGDGFTFGVSVPRFSDNKQIIINHPVNPHALLNDGPWTSYPQTLGIGFHGNTRITTTIDALNGANDNLYNVNVHINA